MGNGNIGKIIGAIGGVTVLTLANGYVWHKNSQPSYCLLGSSMSGKTTLANFIDNGKLLTEHAATSNYSNIGKFIDCGGAESDIKTWQEQIVKMFEKDSIQGILPESINEKLAPRYCFYLYDSSRYCASLGDTTDDHYCKLVKKHLNLIKNYSKDIQIVIIGTHSDMLQDAVNNKEEVKNDLVDFLKTKCIPYKTQIIGSLKTIDEAEYICQELIKLKIIKSKTMTTN